MRPIDIFWHDAKRTMFCSEEEFGQLVAGARFVQWDDDSAAAILGHEIHVAGMRKGWVTRRAIREGFVPLLREYGYLTTRVLRRDRAAQRFVERLGFERCGENYIDIFYRIERCRYEPSH